MIPRDDQPPRARGGFAVRPRETRKGSRSNIPSRVLVVVLAAAATTAAAIDGRFRVDCAKVAPSAQSLQTGTSIFGTNDGVDSSASGLEPRRGQSSVASALASRRGQSSVASALAPRRGPGRLGASIAESFAASYFSTYSSSFASSLITWASAVFDESLITSSSKILQDRIVDREVEKIEGGGRLQTAAYALRSRDPAPAPSR